MLKFAASPEADSLDEFEGHYCQMLISELLYKNYYEQSNREELLKAVDYFDSIVAADGYKTDGRRDAPRASAKNVQNTAFLDARAHYINGVGYYEKDDVVNACAEYLRTLEVMEGHFEEKELVGHKAQFMSLTYGRLGEIFSAQYMMESAITCYEYSLVYCKIKPISPIGVPKILYRIGKQYDKINEIEKARLYYEQALENMTDTDNLVYRDIVSSKVISDYQYGIGLDQLLDELSQIIMLADDEAERLNRYLIIGAIYYEEGIYDSALYYLTTVFENTDNTLFQIQAAEYLRNIYDSIEESEKADVCVHFLVEHKKPEGENKALVSKLDDMFKNYQNQKQEKEAEAERERSIKKTIKIIVPIAVVVVITIIILAKLKSKKLLKEQQEEADRVLGETEQEHENELRQLQAEAEQQLADAKQKHQQKVEEIVKRHEEELKLQKDQSEQEISQTRKRHEEELETERLAYQKEQEALRQSLRQRETQVNILETALTQQRDESERQREAFLKEPICQHINDLLHGKHITTRDTSFKHETIALKEEDFKQLKDAVERHYKGFDNVLLSRYPGLRHTDLALCHLYLIGLGESDIAALRSRTYSGVRKHGENLQEKLGLDESVTKYVMRVAEGLIGHPERVLSEVALDETQGYSQKSSQKSQQRIVDLIKERPEITTAEMAEIIGITRRSIVNITNRLQEEGIIRRVGPDKGGHWEVIE
jgi:tetratricopeptide (TPR) repeat protein/DNA-binding CsgD family transcriptional regulator